MFPQYAHGRMIRAGNHRCPRRQPARRGPGFWLAGLFAAAAVWCQASIAGDRTEFPKLMGINIGAKNYDDARYQQELARLDVVILGFYKGWNPNGDAKGSTAAIQAAVRAIKAHHPGILVGQYTVLNEANDDPGDIATLDLRDKLHKHNWWLRTASNRRAQWTAQYANWEVNITAWARPDADGLRWPEWLAERNYNTFFRAVPEFDIVYVDNVMARSRVTADWNLDGVDDDPSSAEISSAHRAGYLAYWRRLRALLPAATLIGNADNDLGNPQWRNQLDGAVLEALMGENWSIESREGWAAMMARYRAALRNTQAPSLVAFNVVGAVDDFRLFRYAYASCLLDDGYFSFTDRLRGYSSVAWFDEYDYPLGRPLGSPPSAAWDQGVWRRDFEHGIVLVNPGPQARTVMVEPGLRRLSGKQDPAVNSGVAARTLTLPAKDGIVLRR
ncbi:MAG TPA: putative glycoside hydrolase [Usitatibacteraceae bacterium]